MNITLDYLKSNRKWLVRDFRVWGDGGAVESDMIATEADSSNSRIVYLREFAGGVEQVVNFSDLVDHRGNNLPASIANAEIVLIPKNEVNAYIRGTVGPSSFRIARDRNEPADSKVDLLILEMS
ncbi:MAG: hypothetical protein V3W18_06750 [candidate division Zixibacteria bacterium]